MLSGFFPCFKRHSLLNCHPIALEAIVEGDYSPRIKLVKNTIELLFGLTNNIREGDAGTYFCVQHFVVQSYLLV
jgi:hypothetical protein